MASAAAAATEVGQIVLAVGEAKMTGKAVKAGDSVPVGAELSTGADGYLYLKTIDNGFLILRPGSVAVVETYRVDHANPAQSRFKFFLRQGVARSISGEAVGKARKNFRFNTPVAAIGVRGTDFSIYTDAEQTRVAVISGGIIVSGFDGKCLREGSGPCEGADSTELFAGTLGVLQVQKGQAAPLLIEDNSLSPDMVAPPGRDEPAAPATTDTAQHERHARENIKGMEQQQVALDLVKQEQLQPIIWGRWQQLSEDLPATIDLSGLGQINYGMLRLPDSAYILLWDKNVTHPVVTPASGGLAFSLQGGQAHIDGPRGQTEAGVSNGRLSMNFDQSTFSTRIDVSASGQTYMLYANGNINKEGILSTPQQSQSNMTVLGGLFQGQGNKDMDASYLFQATLNGGMTASGITNWHTTP
ncbi:hypothetical protein FACS1894101_2470 [Betaproteobacteria bacterium]|nr:hypothetical protein FACS1894101_2470 [Betaproteobacteria bacterium]